MDLLKDSKIGSSSTGKKGMEILNWALIAVIIVVVAVVLTKVFKAFKLGAEAAGDIAGTLIIEKQTGITGPRQTVCKSVAAECENAITRLPFIGTVVYWISAPMIEGLNRLVTDKEAILASQYFKQISGESLKGYVLKMHDIESNKIKSIIKENLV